MRAFWQNLTTKVLILNGGGWSADFFYASKNPTFIVQNIKL